MKLLISHKTRYAFEEPVQYALQQVRLTPKVRPGQKILDWQINASGGNRELEFDDEHNNRVILFSVIPGSEYFELNVTGQVETSQTGGILGRHGGYAPLWLFQRTTPLTKPGKRVQELCRSIATEKFGDVSQLHDLSAAVSERVEYRIGTTSTETTAEETLEAAAGVCQDHTHVFLSAARKLGYPARYVSGYLMLNDRVEQDASHAWAEVFVDGLGWVGFDVSNSISPDERYVAVATGLDYRQTSPVSGMRFGAGGDSMIVTLQVQQ